MTDLKMGIQIKVELNLVIKSRPMRLNSGGLLEKLGQEKLFSVS